MCRDTFFGDLTVSIWEKTAAGGRQLLVSATSKQAALEASAPARMRAPRAPLSGCGCCCAQVGGGPWYSAWIGRASMKEPFRSLLARALARAHALPVQLRAPVPRLPLTAMHRAAADAAGGPDGGGGPAARVSAPAGAVGDAVPSVTRASSTGAMFLLLLSYCAARLPRRRRPGGGLHASPAADVRRAAHSQAALVVGAQRERLRQQDAVDLVHDALAGGDVGLDHLHAALAGDHLHLRAPRRARATRGRTRAQHRGGGGDGGSAPASRSLPPSRSPCCRTSSAPRSCRTSSSRSRRLPRTGAA